MPPRKPRTLMHRIPSRCPLQPLALALGLLLGGLPLGAQALWVEPMWLEMTPLGRASSASLTVVNTAGKPVLVEGHVARRTIGRDGEEVLTPADDRFLVFPPEAAIRPGATQAFRVQWLGEPDLAESEAYYITLKGTPLGTTGGMSGPAITQTLVVPTRVGHEGAAAARLPLGTTRKAVPPPDRPLVEPVRVDLEPEGLDEARN